MITSKDNARIKAAKKLYQKKYRKHAYLIEGMHLYEEAKKSGAVFNQIFVTDKFSDIPHAILVTDAVMKDLSDAETPQGIVAEVQVNHSELQPEQLKHLLVLENVQDPGNVGTMIRTADAAGFDGIVLTGGTADVYAPKVLRTMQGSHFHLPIFQVSDEQLLYQQLQAQGISLIATTLSNDSIDYRSIQKPHAFALIMGNEGSGIKPETAEVADILAHITMPGQAESLNVAVAAGIMLFALTES